MAFEDDDLETEAIAKCIKALKPLDDDTRVRVVKYLAERFGLVAHQEVRKSNNEDQPSSHSDQHSLNLLEAGADKSPSGNSNGSSDVIPSLRDAMIRGLTKTETELVLIMSFYASNQGKDTFRRQQLLDLYKDNDLHTENRVKNLSANINSLIKSSLLR